MRDRWEELQTWQQVALGFPVFGVLLFLLNLGPFSQPLDSSIIYGILEGALFTGFMLAATAAEKNRRRGGRP